MMLMYFMLILLHAVTNENFLVYMMLNYVQIRTYRFPIILIVYRIIKLLELIFPIMDCIVWWK